MCVLGCCEETDSWRDRQLTRQTVGRHRALRIQLLRNQSDYRDSACANPEKNPMPPCTIEAVYPCPFPFLGQRDHKEGQSDMYVNPNPLGPDYLSDPTLINSFKSYVLSFDGMIPDLIKLLIISISS